MKKEYAKVKLRHTDELVEGSLTIPASRGGIDGTRCTFMPSSPGWRPSGGLIYEVEVNGHNAGHHFVRRAGAHHFSITMDVDESWF